MEKSRATSGRFDRFHVHRLESYLDDHNVNLAVPAALIMYETSPRSQLCGDRYCQDRHDVGINLNCGQDGSARDIHKQRNGLQERLHGGIASMYGSHRRLIP